MDTLQAGITAAREGRHAEAQALLQQTLQANPRSEQGWLWMSAVVESDAERRTCLERVLAINPHNQTARAGLETFSPDHGSAHGGKDYLPISRSEHLEAAATPISTTSANLAGVPASLHSASTLGMDPVQPASRPIRRLAPQPAPDDEIAQLRAARFQPTHSDAQEPPSQTDPFMAIVLLGGLSITALAGALMLAVLWLIGWPP